MGGVDSFPSEGTCAHSVQCSEALATFALGLEVLRGCRVKAETTSCWDAVSTVSFLSLQVCEQLDGMIYGSFILSLRSLMADRLPSC